jgi:hypothetical protein
MSFDLSALNAIRQYQAQPVRAAGPVAPSDAAAKPAAPGAAATVDTFPASPPPELRAEILAAQQAVHDMHARGRELHFEMAEGRLRIELRDLDGNVLRTIPGSEALEIASGKAVE